MTQFVRADVYQRVLDNLDEAIKRCEALEDKLDKLIAEREANKKAAKPQPKKEKP